MDADLIRRAAEMYAAGTPSAIFYTLGITEHTCGTENVQNLANLAMLCGQIGKPSSGVNPLRGQNNVQGGCDMGAIHSVFPGYQRVADPAMREKFAKAWGVAMPTNLGGRVTDFIEKADEGVAQGLLRLRRGPRPQRAEPGQGRPRASASSSSSSARKSSCPRRPSCAHVVLPGACFAEKDGTFTNTERRVQRVRKARGSSPLLPVTQAARSPLRSRPAPVDLAVVAGSVADAATQALDGGLEAAAVTSWETWGASLDEHVLKPLAIDGDAPRRMGGEAVGVGTALLPGEGSEHAQDGSALAAQLDGGGLLGHGYLLPDRRAARSAVRPSSWPERRRALPFSASGLGAW